jgi:trehalose 6-phosphate phosphatase
MTNAGAVLAEQAARLTARADQVALYLDFDGTLSPIGRFAAAALVSGRPADYLAEHAAAPGVRYLGLYGLQEIRDGHLWADPRLEAGRPAVEAAHRDLRDHAAVRDSGAWLEDKRYAVAVHTRRVADPQRWAEPIDQTAREIAARHGLEVVPGKLVWEQRPAVPSDKGDAVRKLAAESGARSAEAPEPLLADADLAVGRPPELRELLDRLAAPPGSS